MVEFQEVRMALEAKSAELAAKRATDEDIRTIKRCLERIEMERNEGSSKMATDLSFHMNIAYASKNIVQIHLMKSFYDVQIYAMSFAYETLYSTMKIDGLMDEQHNSIFGAICDHDPDRARKLIEDHIGTLMEIWREHNL
jgi:DNA-binding FadR family transcriptional regulator